MNFQVNGISYFLTFDTDEAEWRLLMPAHGGIDSVEIHDDGAPLTAAVPHATFKGGARRTH